MSKSNFVLRKILNSEDTLDILKDFIETFLSIEIETIQLNPYLKEKSYYLPAEENFGIADVRIKTTQQEEMNIGIQFIDGKYVQTKMLMYYLQIHTNQIHYADNRKIAKTIIINLLDFIYFNSFPYHKKLFIQNNNQEGYQEEQIEFHVLELPKFQYRQKRNLKKEDIWMLYLKERNLGLLDLAKQKNKKIQKLDSLLEKFWKEEKLE